MANPYISHYGENTRFKPGQSGNPKGRPKGSRNYRTLVRDMLERDDFEWSLLPIKNAAQLEKVYGKSIAKAIIAVAFAQALEGDAQARKWLSETAYGKPRANVVVHHADDRRQQPTPIYDPERDGPLDFGHSDR